MFLSLRTHTVRLVVCAALAVGGVTAAAGYLNAGGPTDARQADGTSGVSTTPSPTPSPNTPWG